MIIIKQYIFNLLVIKGVGLMESTNTMHNKKAYATYSSSVDRVKSISNSTHNKHYTTVFFNKSVIIPQKFKYIIYVALLITTILIFATILIVVYGTKIHSFSQLVKNINNPLNIFFLSMLVVISTVFITQLVVAGSILIYGIFYKMNTNHLKCKRDIDEGHKDRITDYKMNTNHLKCKRDIDEEHKDRITEFMLEAVSTSADRKIIPFNTNKAMSNQSANLDKVYFTESDSIFLSFMDETSGLDQLSLVASRPDNQYSPCVKLTKKDIFYAVASMLCDDESCIPIDELFVYQALRLITTKETLLTRVTKVIKQQFIIQFNSQYNSTESCTSDSYIQFALNVINTILKAEQDYNVLPSGSQDVTLTSSGDISTVMINEIRDITFKLIELLTMFNNLFVKGDIQCHFYSTKTAILPLLQAFLC